jgi:hypothetical protein
MAQTTTERTACDVLIWLDNGSGTLTDISGSANSMDMSFTNNIGDFRTFGARWTKRTVCGSDASFTLNAVYTTASDESYDIIKDWWTGAAYDDDRSLRIQIPDNEANSEQWDMEVVLENFDMTLDSGEGGPIMVTASLLPNGAVVHGTIGS